MSATIIIENPDGVPSIGLNNKEKIANNLLGIETLSMENHLIEKVIFLEKESKIIKYVCIFETLNNVVLIFIVPAPILLLAIAASYAGYVGANEFRISLVRFHLVWEIVISFAKLYSLVYYYNKIQQFQYILNLLGSFFQFVLTFITFRFLKILIEVKNNVLE